MKYLKTYQKINESYNNDLVDYIDDDLIEKYYDKYYHIDFNEALDIYPNLVEDYIDDDAYIQSWIDSDIENNSFDDYSDYHFKEYIKKFLTEDKKEKIIELYNDNNYLDEDDDKITEYDNDLLDDLDDDQLKEVIEVDSSEYDFVVYCVNDRYGGYRYAMEIIEEFYGDLKKQERESTYYKYGYGAKPIKLYDLIKDYFDKEGFIKACKDSEDNDFKKEWVGDQIGYSKKLQKNILKNKKSAVLELEELISKYKSKSNICDEFDFQKLYIKYYVKDNNVFEKGEDGYEEERDELIADALLYLYNNYGLNNNISKLYPKQMWKVSGKKYNL